jgi:hypothetical protein
MAQGLKTGGCLCGGVRFELTGALRPIIVCHCGQCRKQTGGTVAATQVASDDLVMLSDATLTWFRASEGAQRGFCGRCGSVLFWRPDDRPVTSIMAGALDGPTGLAIEKHIFVADKPDWYEITDGKPQDPQWTP